LKIAIAGIGYVGLSNGVLLAQHNEVIALDVIAEKVELLNQKKEPIQDFDIKVFSTNKALNFRATFGECGSINLSHLSSKNTKLTALIDGDL